MVKHTKSLMYPILLVMYEIATYLSNDMYLPALPQMMTDIGLNTKQAQLTLTTWFLGSASMPLIMGAMSDRYGRRSVLLWGGVIYIITTVMCAMVQDETSLLLARFVQGGMVSTMMVSGYASIHELYDRKEAIRILALMASIVIIAPGLGPSFGAIVLYFTSWRGIFWLIAAWSTLVIAALYFYMPESLTLDKREPLHVMALLHKYLRLLVNKQFILLLSVLGILFCGFLSWVTAGSLLIINSYHYSAMVFGIAQAVVFGANVLGNYCVEYLLNVLSIKWLIQLGLAVNLVGGLLMLVVIFAFPQSLILFLIAMIAYSFGSGLCYSSLNRMAIETSTEPMGIRVALFTACMTGFAALGSVLSSIFFDGTTTSLAWLLVIPCLTAYLIQLFTKPVTS